MNITINSTLTVEDAVTAFQLATARENEAKTVWRQSVGEPNFREAVEEVNEAYVVCLAARANAQYAIKRATGYFPVDLALMGL